MDQRYQFGTTVWGYFVRDVNYDDNFHLAILKITSATSSSKGKLATLLDSICLCVDIN